MRRLAITKIAALTLIALILLPFTAPFKTYALSTPRSQHSDDQFVKDKLGSDDTLVEPSQRGPVPAALTLVVSPPSLTNQIEQPHLHFAVLRI
jgi:hypothetical protein